MPKRPNKPSKSSKPNKPKKPKRSLAEKIVRAEDKLRRLRQKSNASKPTSPSRRFDMRGDRPDVTSSTYYPKREKDEKNLALNLVMRQANNPRVTVPLSSASTNLRAGANYPVPPRFHGYTRRHKRHKLLEENFNLFSDGAQVGGDDKLDENGQSFTYIYVGNNASYPHRYSSRTPTAARKKALYLSRRSDNVLMHRKTGLPLSLLKDEPRRHDTVFFKPQTQKPIPKFYRAAFNAMKSKPHMKGHVASKFNPERHTNNTILIFKNSKR